MVKIKSRDIARAIIILDCSIDDYYSGDYEQYADDYDKDFICSIIKVRDAIEKAIDTNDTVKIEP